MVKGTVTCTEAEAEVAVSLDMYVTQLAPDDSGAYGSGYALVDCGAEGTREPYEARGAAEAGEFGGGRVRVTVVYSCSLEGGGECEDTQDGTFTIQGAAPVGTANKTGVLTLYGTPGADDRYKEFSFEIWT